MYVGLYVFKILLLYTKLVWLSITQHGVLVCMQWITNLSLGQDSRYSDRFSMVPCCPSRKCQDSF
jgi:hypothetical protein